VKIDEHCSPLSVALQSRGIRGTQGDKKIVMVSVSAATGASGASSRTALRPFDKLTAQGDKTVARSDGASADMVFVF